MIIITRKSPKLGNFMHYHHQADARHAGFEQVLNGYQQMVAGYEQVLIRYEQIQVGSDENGPIYADGDPIYANGEPILADNLEAPIYINGADLFAADWDEAWGEAPTDGDLAAWEEPEPEENPLTDVETASRALATRRQTREDVIFSDTSGLVATCYAWLQRECTVPGGGNDKKTASQALQAGQGLCSTTGYGVALRAWIDFAAPDFYQAMSAPDEARPWLEWVPAGESKSIREAILDRVHLATYGTARK